MRRFLSSLLLALCLGVAQHGALLHSLRHDLARTGLATEDDNPRTEGTVCLTCLAFAHVAGAVASPVVATPLLSLAFHWTPDLGFARLPAKAPRARSRGPPFIG
jgi:hypothetical protein